MCRELTTCYKNLFRKVNPFYLQVNMYKNILVDICNHPQIYKMDLPILAPVFYLNFVG